MDVPFTNKALQVGRVVGGSFISLGSATTDSVGIFDFRFVGTMSIDSVESSL